MTLKRKIFNRNKTFRQIQKGGGFIKKVWKSSTPIKDKQLLIKQIIDSNLSKTQYSSRQYSPQLLVYLDSLTSTDNVLTIDEARQLLTEIGLPFIEDPDIFPATTVEATPQTETAEEKIANVYAQTQKVANFGKQYLQVDAENRKCQEDLARLIKDLERIGLEREALESEIQTQRQTIARNEEQFKRIRKEIRTLSSMVSQPGGTQQAQIERLQADIAAKEIESSTLLENIAAKEKELEIKESEISRIRAETEQLQTQTQPNEELEHLKQLLQTEEENKRERESKRQHDLVASQLAYKLYSEQYETELQKEKTHSSLAKRISFLNRMLYEKQKQKSLGFAFDSETDNLKQVLREVETELNTKGEECDAAIQELQELKGSLAERDRVNSESFLKIKQELEQFNSRTGELTQLKLQLDDANSKLNLLQHNLSGKATVEAVANIPTRDELRGSITALLGKITTLQEQQTGSHSVLNGSLTTLAEGIQTYNQLLTQQTGAISAGVTAAIREGDQARTAEFETFKDELTIKFDEVRENLEEVQGLRVAAQQAQERYQGLLRNIGDVRAQLEGCRSTLTAKETELAANRGLLAGLRQSLETVIAQQAAKDAAAEGLRQEVERAHEAQRDAERSNVEITRQATEARAESERKTTQAEEAQRELQRIQREGAESREQVAGLQARFQELVRAREQADEKARQAVQQQIEQTRLEEQAQATVRAAVYAAQVADQGANELRERVQQQQEQLGQITAQANQAIADAQQQQQQYANALAAERARADALQAQLDGAGANLPVITGQLQAERARADAAEAERDAQTDRADALQAERDALQAERDGETERANAQTTRANAASQGWDVAEAEVVRLEEIINFITGCRIEWIGQDPTKTNIPAGTEIQFRLTEASRGNRSVVYFEYPDRTDFVSVMDDNAEYNYTVREGLSNVGALNLD